MSLSQEEKEQVAVLLGWKRVLPSRFDDEATWFNTDGDLCWEEIPSVTLEACMEYAKGKGWDYQLSGGATWDSEATVYTTNQSRQYATPFYGLDESDPLAAMVRALLKAEEASSES